MKTYIVTEKDIERLELFFTDRTSLNFINSWINNLKPNNTVGSNIDLEELEKNINKIFDDWDNDKVKEWLISAKK